MPGLSRNKKMEPLTKMRKSVERSDLGGGGKLMSLASNLLQLRPMGDVKESVCHVEMAGPMKRQF